ncbi:50S ribosomal protein L11 methyltransferase [Trichlorobacter ammonificans]|uniref:Ribosomal protein L11 methyltransferase n=1 Tax=Trichlorobacter ammonificans TaxID=2916410 RepID=A0ABN8HDM2_9BACT|nr:50S ribosomal protein L11 methyltransferase [Trichlorobacter ammonificans]CAH2030868.1 Ribosomal protein L11 methyltransferase [Trichlorobacter ammonificans]
MSGRIFTSFSIGLFTVVPAGDPYPSPCGLPIVLGKKGAFGSGEHETTAACLEILPTIPGIAGCHALDLGSGTGILALAVARLGAGSVVAVDLDPAAAVSCRENVAHNWYDDRISTVCGELASLEAQQFDLVMANIYADILLPLADRLVAMTNPGGHLLLSGIPLQDKFDIVRCYTALGCCVVDSRIGEEFATYLLLRP